jgi:two-component sensor histidine kinase
MNELDHRVKNNLASVLGISRQTMATSTSLEHFRSAFEGRLKAMARTHDALAGNRWMGVVLYDITNLVLKPYMDNEHSRFTISGDDLVILPRSVMPLSLSLHELAINASKYGSLTSSQGRVSVHWTIKNSDLVIEWTETGGPPAHRPVRPGTGLSLIEGLVSYELRGSVNIEFLPTGFRCMLIVPVSEAVFSLDEATAKPNGA